jgi:hypothetical protein
MGWTLDSWLVPVAPPALMASHSALSTPGPADSAAAALVSPPSLPPQSSTGSPLRRLQLMPRVHTPAATKIARGIETVITAIPNERRSDIQYVAEGTNKALKQRNTAAVGFIQLGGVIKTLAHVGMLCFVVYVLVPWSPR